MNQHFTYLKITKYIIFVLLFVFFSCKLNETTLKKGIPISEKKINSVTKIDLQNRTDHSKKTTSVNKWLDPVHISDKQFNTFKNKSDFKNQIHTYYNKKYEEIIKNFDKDANNHWTRSKNNIKLTPSDSILKISYLVTENRSYDISIVSLEIPLKPDNNSSFIFGDVNNDQKEDCLVTVFSEGGWSASNTSNNDIFIFLNKENKYKLTYVFTSSGNYNPVLIKNNQIIANELSYAPEDPRCCPSLQTTDTTNLNTLKNYLKIIQ